MPSSSKKTTVIAASKLISSAASAVYSSRSLLALRFWKLTVENDSDWTVSRWRSETCHMKAQ